MCIVVDACAFSRVFDGDDPQFGPVKKWIFSGRGRMVFGGTSYIRELNRLKKYLPIVAELSRQGKVVRIKDGEVDVVEKRVKKLVKSTDFDDPHIVAIVDVSGCRLVCTLDARADRFLRDSSLYKKSRRPSIYRSASHLHLLRNSNIVGACIC